MKRFSGILILIILLGSQLSAQTKKFSLEDFFVKGTFQTSGVYGLRSMNDGEHYTVLENNRSKIVKYNYKTGKPVATLLDLSQLENPSIKFINDYEFNKDESRLLLCTNRQAIYRRSFTADYYVYDLKNKELKSLSEEGSQRLATFSPNGTHIAFVRDNNLFVHDLRFGTERQITHDGEYNRIINGAPDWVYEEEFGFNKAFEWSPDGSAIAYIKFDESDVREFQMNMFEGRFPTNKENALYPSNYTYKYPKAGEKNAKVSVFVYDINDRTTHQMETGDEEDIYLPRIRWTQTPNRLAIIRLNRHQNKMEVLLANSKTGNITPLYREENKYYIDESNLDNLVFLENNRFIITSEKSGYMHLYLYDMSGRERQALTKGNFDIIDFYGYDPVRKLYYYSSYEESPLEKYVYSINEKGQKKKLTPVKGWNEAAFSSNFNYYINTVSNADLPPVVALYDAKGKQVRVLKDNKCVKEELANYQTAKREFIQIPAADGKTMLNAWIMKPVHPEAGKKYPLLITQYSGPNSQQVKNNWKNIDWLDLLVQDGFIVACVDPRGTAARGEEFRKCTYRQLGKIESDDIIAAAKWLAAQDDVDEHNVGIWGWSFGGFMSSLCIMKGSDVFSTAIAVAPVTNWRYYDSIYTERYMRTPGENEKGYDENSPMNYVDRLEGNLLICHGTADDNVHVQNAYELAERLVQANKQFDMAIYTNRNHFINGGNTSRQLYGRFIKYLKEKMQ